MKKLLLALLLTLVFVSGCSNNSPAASDISLADVVEKLTKDADTPMYETTALDKENFAFFTNMEYDSSYEAVQADALINASAHSVVLIRCDKTEEVATKLSKSADPRKWICVMAEDSKVAYSDHYVLLVMSYSDVTPKMLENFEAFVSEVKDGTVKTLDVAG